MRSNCDDNVNLDVFVFSQGKKGWALDSPGGGRGQRHQVVGLIPLYTLWIISKLPSPSLNSKFRLR